MPTDASAAFEKLFQIIQRLRSPDGCAWDRAQSPTTLRASLIDEAWECVSSIDARDDRNMEEELGDLYLLVTMLAWMKEQEGSFTVQSTLARIADKLVRRHPHIFARSDASSVDEILAQWDEIKETEKAGREKEPGSALDRVPRSLPPLEKSAELQKKAAKVGFDWPGPQPVWEKIDEELRELREALTEGELGRIEDEMGDLLFSVVNLSRLLGIEPAVALHGANGKFERRFRAVEKLLAASGVRPAEAGLQRMDQLWEQVKAQESSSGAEGESPAGPEMDARSASK